MPAALRRLVDRCVFVAMRNAFWRNEDGSWICIDPVTIDHPKGRVQVSPGTTLSPGMLYMGIDLPNWLDDQIRKLPPPSA